MPIDIDRAVAHLAAITPAPRWPAGAPARDYTRSPAAMAVGRLAVEQGLSLFHFEHRATLELPEGWVAPGREEDARPPGWVDGVLPESKYQSFRHDLYLGSFHPGHRGKWTTHELCHGLVGTAWRVDATPFFHATAARLAELLPVVLYYFLDEIGLRRCPDHAGDGALFRTFCPRCEAAVDGGPGAIDDAERWLVAARDFLDRELAAVARSRRLGRPISHRWATIDLASDGVAYAAAHDRRLSSPLFARFAERFSVGYVSLDELEERVVEVARGICEGAPVRPGPGRWVAQDVASRLLQVAEDADGEAHDGLLALVDALADGAPLAEIAAGYRRLYEGFVLPIPDELFAVGYDLGVDGLGRSVGQVREGLRTVVPLVLELAGDAGLDLVPAFVAADPSERRPLGERFAGWLAAAHPGPAAELARYEVALRAAAGDPLVGSLGADPELVADAPWRLAAGARALVADLDVTVLAEAVDRGEVQGEAVDGRLVLRGALPEPAPTGILVGRDGSGEVLVVEVPAEAAAVLAGGGEPELAPDERALLVELGLLVPSAWRLARG